MAMQILQFLIDTLFFFLIAACLLRMWMNFQHIRLAQQPGPFVMALTDWLVVPVRRVLPRALAQSDADWGSLTAAVLLGVAYGVVTWMIWAGAAASPVWIFLMTLRVLARSALQLVMLLAFAYAILSWVQPRSPVMGTLGRIVDPLARPLRRVIPTIGGVDLSLLVLIIVAQVGLMLVG